MTSENEEEDEEIDLLRGFEKPGLDNEDLQKQVRDNDKLFRLNKTDPVRAELYRSLIGFFNTTDLEKAQLFYLEADAEMYRQLCTPERIGCGRDQWMNKRKKIQDLTQYIRGGTATDYVISTCAMLDLKRVITDMDRLTWRALALTTKRGFENNRFNNIDPKELLKLVTDYMGEELKGYAEVKTSTKFYDHSKRHGQFCFLMLREQNLATPKFTQTVFAFSPGVPNLFIHFGKQADMNLTKMVVRAMGFKSCKPQRLRAQGLTPLYQSCIRTVSALEKGIPYGRGDGPVGLRGLLGKFHEEELEKNARGVRSLFPAAEKMLKLQCALIDDNQMPGVDVCKIVYKVPNQADEGDDPATSSAAKKPRMSEISWKMKAKEGTLDKNFAELYRMGRISNITPYLRMKKSQTNHITIHRPNW